MALGFWRVALRPASQWQRLIMSYYLAQFVLLFNSGANASALSINPVGKGKG